MSDAGEWSEVEVDLSEAEVVPELAEEFPGLGLSYVTVDRGSGRSSRGIKHRLRILSSRFSGPQAIHLREQPIPWAYRVFYRHIGLDPDAQPTPVEEIALERLKQGGFKSRNRLDDALTIAMIESGVALCAFDADRVEPPLVVRPSKPGERMEGLVNPLTTGSLVVCDRHRPVSLLFGEMAAERGVHPKTKRIILVATRVKSVPRIAVEEALWLAAEILTNG